MERPMFCVLRLYTGTFYIDPVLSCHLLMEFKLHYRYVTCGTKLTVNLIEWFYVLISTMVQRRR